MTKKSSFEIPSRVAGYEAPCCMTVVIAPKKMLCQSGTLNTVSEGNADQDDWLD